MTLGSDELACDLLVVGSGAGGLTTALTASHAQLNVLVIEKDACFGGASARSGGGLWVPGNSLAARAGIADRREDIVTYLQHEAKGLFDARRVEAFLDNGPDMVDFVERTSHVRFFLPPSYPDYHPHHPGGAANGRSVFAKAIDARPLGRRLSSLRRPLHVSTFMSLPVGLQDMRYFMTAGRSVRSFGYVTRLVLRLFWDVVRYGRSMRLASGNALVGGLAASVMERGVTIQTSTPAHSLLTDGDRVIGAMAMSAGRPVRILARRGVVLATGGFPHDAKRRSELLPQGANRAEVWALMPYSNTGDGLRMAEAVGGYVEARMRMPVALAPVQRVDAHEGELTSFPVFASRGTPGSIAVRRDGCRFVNEASSYHDFALALLAASADDDEPVAFIISDHRAVRRYGLGHVRPFPVPVGHHVRNGYLLRADTLGQLAHAAGIDPIALKRTVAKFNDDARVGRDPHFGRGGTAYDLRMGDATHGPNPCLGPLEHAPYYAIRVVPGCVGTFAGLQTNEYAQVLRRSGTPIAGLYAVGNDLASITGGDYVGGGCTLGPAMTFGYIAARHAAAVAASSATRARSGA